MFLGNRQCINTSTCPNPGPSSTNLTVLNARGTLPFDLQPSYVVPLPDNRGIGGVKIGSKLVLFDFETRETFAVIFLALLPPVKILLCDFIASFPTLTAGPSCSNKVSAPRSHELALLFRNTIVYLQLGINGMGGFFCKDSANCDFSYDLDLVTAIHEGSLGMKVQEARGMPLPVHEEHGAAYIQHIQKIGDFCYTLSQPTSSKLYQLQDNPVKTVSPSSFQYFFLDDVFVYVYLEDGAAVLRFHSGESEVTLMEWECRKRASPSFSMFPIEDCPGQYVFLCTEIVEVYHAGFNELFVKNFECTLVAGRLALQFEHQKGSKGTTVIDATSVSPVVMCTSRRFFKSPRHPSFLDISHFASSSLSIGLFCCSTPPKIIHFSLFEDKWSISDLISPLSRHYACSKLFGNAEDASNTLRELSPAEYATFFATCCPALFNTTDHQICEHLTCNLATDFQFSCSCPQELTLAYRAFLASFKSLLAASPEALKETLIQHDLHDPNIDVEGALSTNPLLTSLSNFLDPITMKLLWRYFYLSLQYNDPMPLLN